MIALPAVPDAHRHCLKSLYYVEQTTAIARAGSPADTLDRGADHTAFPRLATSAHRRRGRPYRQQRTTSERGVHRVDGAALSATTRACDPASTVPRRGSSSSGSGERASESQAFPPSPGAVDDGLRVDGDCRRNRSIHGEVPVLERLLQSTWTLSPTARMETAHPFADPRPAGRRPAERRSSLLHGAFSTDCRRRARRQAADKRAARLSRTATLGSQPCCRPGRASVYPAARNRADDGIGTTFTCTCRH